MQLKSGMTFLEVEEAVKALRSAGAPQLVVGTTVYYWNQMNEHGLFAKCQVVDTHLPVLRTVKILEIYYQDGPKGSIHEDSLLNANPSTELFIE
ncbi:MAG TPA: hypothetical protein VG965_03745 [Patescibacteria group bacterium]|nr:hypothetical protein [Patescibacteria group bacterium]